MRVRPILRIEAFYVHRAWDANKGGTTAPLRPLDGAAYAFLAHCLWAARRDRGGIEMAWLSGRLALLPWPALLLMVIGAALSFGSRFWQARLFPSKAQREMQIKWAGLILVFVGVILVFTA